MIPEKEENKNKNEKFYPVKFTRAMFKSQLHRELTKAAVEKLIKETPMPRKLARQIIRQAIKRKLWLERKSKIPQTKTK